MNDEYYYIKLKSFDYDQPDRFLTDLGLSISPQGVRVFDDLDEAIDIKKTIQEGHKSYGYKIEIVRF